MAPKQTKETKNPPMVSSREEENEESRSFAEKSNSFGEEDVQEKPTQMDVVVPLPSKPVQKSHVSSPKSSTDDDEAKKKKKVKRSRTHKQVKKLDTDDEAKKKKKERLRVDATDEEIYGDDDEVKKKMKKSRTEEIEEEVTEMPKEETKNQLALFQRIFSKEDELALLQGIIDFASTRGDPYKDTDVFCDFLKQLISFDATKTQLLSKVRKLKVKFGETVKRSLHKGKGGEDKIVFSKDFEQKAFELSRKIWGVAGVLASKPRRMKEESEKPETNVATSPLSSGKEIASLFKDENLTSFGLDESSLLACWNMVADGPKKREIEEKLKRLKTMKVELCLKRTDIVADAANFISEGVNASSSDGKLPDPKEKENEAFVTMAAIEKEDSCVASRGIKDGSGSNQSVSRKKLLVLDINGLLASIVSPLPDYKADFNIGGKAVFKRRFCQDFIKFCFENFEVGIWSSRKKKNVERISEFLLGDMKSKLLFCWDISYCATTSVKSLENRHKSVVFKDLNKLWDKHDQKLPWQKGDYNESNTILLDDSPYKALLNPPYTAIFPHSYDHQNKTDTSLGNGGDLRLYLEKLVGAENVQEFIRKNPFGQEAITESSDTWEFYSQAIRTSNRNLG